MREFGHYLGEHSPISSEHVVAIYSDGGEGGCRFGDRSQRG